jgi:bifunctional non-homologous end joining protein LigD
MARPVERRRHADAAALPQWIRPQLTKLVDAAPDGPDWLHESGSTAIAACAASSRETRAAHPHWARLGAYYPATAAAVATIGARQAYLDGELCGVRADGITSFSMIQAASDSGNAAALVFFLFDLIYLDLSSSDRQGNDRRGRAGDRRFELGARVRRNVLRPSPASGLDKRL